jgi:hypothetical protein
LRILCFHARIFWFATSRHRWSIVIDEFKHSSALPALWACAAILGSPRVPQAGGKLSAAVPT